MKKILAFFTMLTLAGCCAKAPDNSVLTMGIENDVVIKTTPVKNQGRSELCWLYAMLATIESEHLMLGDSVNLSPDYLARLWLKEQTHACYLTQGRTGVSMRGMSSMVPRLMQAYGIEPYDGFRPLEPVNYRALARKAMMVARAAGSLKQLDARLDDILDHETAYLPPSLFMLGMAYTPQQFAESVCLPGEYLSLTSFTHHPFYREFVFESADNRLRDSYLNVPIHELMSRVVGALRRGHPVCWEGDISEPGFNFAGGLATLSRGNDVSQAALDEDAGRSVTQEQRQRDFERFRTSDNHCMELCGVAHDRQGRLLFLAKNSWGKDNAMGGYMYLTYNYVTLKTIAFFMTKKAWLEGGYPTIASTKK